MPPDIYNCAVKLRAMRGLGEQLDGQRLIDWAFSALESGLESQQLLLLAGSNNSQDIRDLFDLFESTMKELFTLPEGDELLFEYTRVICQEFLEDKITFDDANILLSDLYYQTCNEEVNALCLTFWHQELERELVAPGSSEKEFKARLKTEFSQFLDAPVRDCRRIPDHQF